MKRFTGFCLGSNYSFVLITLISFIFSACSQEDCLKTTKIKCFSPFAGGEVLMENFNLKHNDTVYYVFYGKGDFQTPLDSFVVLVDINEPKNTPNSAYVKLGDRFDKNFDWKITAPSGENYYLTDIRTYTQECVRCGKNNSTYFDQYIVKVNGEEQVGYITITK